MKSTANKSTKFGAGYPVGEVPQGFLHVAQAFDNLVHDKSAHGSWMRGEIYYHLNDVGEIDRIDEVNMMLCGVEPKLPGE